MNRTILLLLLLGLSVSQVTLPTLPGLPRATTTVLTTQEQALSAQFSNPQFLKIINNFFGCKTWENGQCVACSQSFYFNAKGICCEVKENCRQFNQAIGICERCYEGYGVIDGQCKIIDLTNVAYRGCKTFQNGVCTECAQRFYLNTQRVCTPVDDSCRVWNSTGACSECYRGFIIQGNSCVVDPNRFIPPSDSLCKRWQDSVCLECADRAYFGANGVCQPVSNFCNTWEKLTGACLSCYKGYKAQNNTCILDEVFNGSPKDIGCALWDWDRQVCLECSQRWRFNAQGVCVSQDDFCQTFGTNGSCTVCYKGYDLTGGVCVFSRFNTALPTDLGCANWDWDKQICLRCSQRFRFNAAGKCIAQDNFCKTFDANGLCTECFKGYIRDTTGNCIPNPVNSRAPTDLGCALWNWDNQTCLQCSQRWRFNAQGVCVPLDNNCRTFGNDNGTCTECYKGYALQNGTCVLSEFNNRTPSDLGCALWDWDNQVCLNCSQRWRFNNQNKCVPLDDSCKIFNANGSCVQCYKGYVIANNVCALNPINNRGPTDLGCALWDWDNQVCLNCSQRWRFNDQRKCVAIDDFCDSFSASGICAKCYKGYDLRNGTCVFSTSNTAPPPDLGCALWDWDNRICLKCSVRFFFNAQGVCIQGDNNCLRFNDRGVCQECYQGYQSQNSGCVLVNPLCKQLNAVGECSACYNGFVLYKKNCTPLSQLANIALYYAECCPEKLAELRQAGRIV